MTDRLCQYLLETVHGISSRTASALNLDFGMKSLGINCIPVIHYRPCNSIDIHHAVPRFGSYINAFLVLVRTKILILAARSDEEVQYG
jgi:hypothetical protein